MKQLTCDVKPNLSVNFRMKYFLFVVDEVYRLLAQSTKCIAIVCKIWWHSCMNASWPQFYQTRSAWSMDQGSTKKRSAVHNFVSTVTKFCVMWEGLSLPHDTKFGNCRGAIVDRRVIFIWSLIHGLSWSGLIKVGPGLVLFSLLYHTIQKEKPPV